MLLFIILRREDHVAAAVHFIKENMLCGEEGKGRLQNTIRWCFLRLPWWGIVCGIRSLFLQLTLFGNTNNLFDIFPNICKCTLERRIKWKLDTDMTASVFIKLTFCANKRRKKRLIFVCHRRRKEVFLRFPKQR